MWKLLEILVKGNRWVGQMPHVDRCAVALLGLEFAMGTNAKLFEG